MDDAWLVDAAAWPAVRPYGAVAGAVVVDSGAVRWFRTEIEYEGFNGVLSARLPECGLDGTIQQAVAPPDVNVDSLVELRAACGLGADPPTSHLLGLLDGTPVGCAAVFVGDQRDGPPPAAWVEWIVTATAARRRGIGGALVHACLALARSRGLRRAVLTSSPDGHGIYRRLGFRDCCTVSRYRYPPAG
jgi:GNAT superfamily N-acetyltransferase